MKNKFKLFLCAFFALGLLWSCNKSEDPGPQLPTELKVFLQDPSMGVDAILSAGGTKQFEFLAPAAWTAGIDATWCKLSTVEGLAGSASVVITAEKNTTSANRLAKLTITSEGKTLVYEIEQRMQATLSLDQDLYFVQTAGETVAVVFNSDVEYEKPVFSETWITVGKAPAAKAAYPYEFVVAKNEAKALKRSATITFKEKYSAAKKVVTVVQSGVGAEAILVKEAGAVAATPATYVTAATKKLVVAGTLNAADITAITRVATSLAVLDLGAATLTEIPADAFMDMVTFTTIVLPASVRSIGAKAFSGSKLGVITFLKGTETVGQKDRPTANSIATIGSSAFSRTLLTTIELPGSLTATGLGSGVFAGCKILSTVTFAFSGYDAAGKEKANALTALPAKTFLSCSQLSSVTLPAGLLTIGANAFEDCFALSALVVPPKVTTVGNDAFSVCSALTSMSFTSALTTLGETVWNNCTALKTLTFASTTPPTIELGMGSATDALGDSNEFYGLSVVVPASANDAYKAVPAWATYVK